MRKQRWATVAIASAGALLSTAGLMAGSAAASVTAAKPATARHATSAARSAATASRAAPASRKAATSPAGVQLSDLVSSGAVGWTPNVFAGPSACNPQWFGTARSGRGCNHSTVYSTAVVNGEVIVVGAFTQACQPGPSGSGHCAAGTLVTTNDIFAYQLGTGQIDPGFAPVLDQGPVYSVVAGPNDTVYIGGAFNTVNGTAAEGVAQLSVTPGQPTDGQLVPGFAGTVDGPVRALAFDGANALYVGGVFAKADGKREHGIARLDATTGAFDSSFQFTLGNAISRTSLEVEQTALTPDGNTLVIGGTFQSVNGQAISRIALIGTGGGLGSPATLDNWSAPVLTNACSAEHDYTRAIDVSPDGSFFVVATTGYRSTGGPSICDAAARFEIGASGTDVQPTWVNYAGGDSFYAVAIAGNVVYLGGHNRWVNNECGNNHVCEANALLANGLAAVDANTGIALPWWQPQSLRGAGVTSLTVFPAGAFPGSSGGLLVGTDVNSIGGAFHGEEALFPMTDMSTYLSGGPVESGMFSLGRPGGEDETSNGPAAMCIDDAGSGAPGDAVQLATCTYATSQNWIIGSDGTIQINSKCLDTDGEGIADNTLTVLDTCNGSPTQVWTQGAGDSLVNQGSGLCLDDPGASTNDGTQLQILDCDGSMGQSWPLPVAQAPPPPPATGPISSEQDQNNSQVPCLESTTAKPKPGARVVLHTCVGGAAQIWTVQLDGTLRLGGLCLDTAGEATDLGTPIVLGTCTGSPTQVWAQQPGNFLGNQETSGTMCLDDPGFNTANGVQMQLWSCNGGPNQQWHLPKV